MGDTKLALSGLDWFAAIGAPASLIDAAKKALSSAAAGAPPIAKQPDTPAYGEGADDWDNIAEEINVSTPYGQLVYVKLQAHNIGPLVNQLSDVLVAGQAASTAAKGAQAKMHDAVKKIAQYVADPKKAAGEITHLASDDAVGRANDAMTATLPMKWGQTHKDTVDTLAKLARTHLNEVNTQIAALSKHKKADALKKKAEMLQKAIEAAVDAVKDFAAAGPEGAALSLWASATKVAIPNPLMDQAEKLDEEARALDEKALTVAVEGLKDVLGDIDKILAEVEKTKQEIGAAAGEKMKAAGKRYGDDTKGGFNFEALTAAIDANKTALESATQAHDLWANALTPWNALFYELGNYEYKSRGRAIPIDGERVGGTVVGGVAGSRADMVRNAKIKERNTPLMQSMGKAIEGSSQTAETAQYEAEAMGKRLDALLVQATDALVHAPGKHHKA